MKTLNKLFILSLLITGASVAGGEYLDMPWMYDAAMIGFGMVAILGGARIMITGQARGASTGMSTFYRETENTQRFSGSSARLIGALLLLAGPLVISMAILDLTFDGGMDAAWEEFLKSPRVWGIAAGLSGLMITMMGIVRARTGTAATPGARSEVVETEFKMGGILAIIAGVVLMAAAVVLIVAPDLFQS